MEVAILVFDGVDELDAIGPFEVFQNAAGLGADVRTKLVTLEPADEVSGSHGLRFRPDGTLSGTPDLVVVPGGGWNDRSEAGAWAEAQKGALPQAVARLYGEGATVASVCTGGMLLSAAGLTKGRPAITHHGAVEGLREAGAEVVEARVVDDGDLLTAGGVTSGIDLALWIVEREFGSEVADGVASEMEHGRRGPVVQSEKERG